MDNSKNSIIILAAGNGSRLKSETPKVYHKIGGLQLIDHIIKSAREINPGKIAVVVNPKHKDFAFEFEDDVVRVPQNSPKGTGDAVKCALQVLDLESEGYIYVLYGDIPLISADMLKKMQKVAEKCEKTAVVVLGMPTDPSQNLGRLISTGDDDKISEIIEASDDDGSRNTLFLANTGLLIRKDVLKKFINSITPNKKTGEFYITDIVKMAHDSGYVCRFSEGSAEELWGVNTRADLALLEQHFQDSMRAKILRTGVTLTAPETVFFSFDTKIENDVTIYPYVIFGRGAYVKKGAEVGPFTVIEGAEISAAKVGPFARIRPRSKIENDARIGNFVEIKNSKISEKAKVNHLSYIGDSSVGAKTNIGAGTITCNYDGFEKFKTEIGENVFVGSNTAIVAPVKIENSAMIGAGSVITKPVRENDLAVARGRQKNIENGAKDFREKRSQQKISKQKVSKKSGKN